MATQQYPTKSAITPSKYGEVTARVAKTLIVQVNAQGIEMDNDVTEVHLVVNGRIVSRMHPERARRMGLTLGPQDW